MAETGFDGPFGNLGLATYDEEGQEWHFARSPYDYLAVVGASDGHDLPLRHSRSVGLSTSSRSRALLTSHPELQPGGSTAQDLLDLSEAVIANTAHYDVAIASRLSLGYIYDYGQNRAVPIIASATGATGDTITLVKLQFQRQGWRDSTRAWIQVPVPSAYTASWSGPETPIQQLVLARTTEPAGAARYLAARCFDRSFIFQLALTRQGLSMKVVHEISGNDLLHIKHIDVSFNPWYSQQYAIIDMSGNWKVWQLEFKAEMKQSSVAQYNNSSSAGIERINDGWRKIMWAGSSTMLAVCSRTHIALYSIESGVMWLHDFDLGIRHADCWVLDTVVHPERPGLLFALTGTHMLAWILLSTHNGLEVRNVIKLKHHCNHNDLSMRLHVQPDGDGIIVLLRSNLNGLVLCYKFGNIDSPAFTIKGPASIIENAEDKPLDLNIVPVHLGQRGAVEHTTAQTHMQQTLSTSLVIYLKQNFELGQRLFCMTDNTTSSYDFRLPDWTHGGALKLPSTVEDSFVVQDDDETETLDLQRPVSRFVRRLQHFAHDQRGLEWTIDLSSVASTIVSKALPTTHIKRVFEKVKDVKASPVADNDLPVRVLQSYGERAHVSSVEEDNTTLQRLLIDTRPGERHEDPRYITAKLLLPHVDGLGDLDNLSTIYDHIVAAWLRPLPASVSGRIRLAKEVLARQLSAELTLASHVLRVVDGNVDTAQPQDEGEPSTYDFNLPIRNIPADSSEAQRTTAQLSALPTPSPTATPSVLTQASQSSAYTPHRYHITSVTTFAKPLPVSLPRSTQRVLRHWETGADPATYDWRSYSRRITRQAEMEDLDSQLTEEERARLQRKAERLLKRERREAAATREQQALSSQMPELVVSASQPNGHPNTSYSQPTGLDLGIASSQIQPAAASQAVQGRYGDRPAKKKRKQGF